VSTVVFFHAHPDDETLLTGGTMARLAGEGHRVVLVTATDGEAGLSMCDTERLGSRRSAELADAGRFLGCSQVERLGLADSGSGAMPRPGSFATLPVEEVAELVAGIVRREHADVLVGYDPAGGYGHRDHVQVHRVARAAAVLARPSMLMEATVDRRALQRALRFTQLHRWYGPAFAATRFDHLYTDRAAITHRIDVTSVVRQKRAAMRAHRSQAAAAEETRTLAVFEQFPDFLFRAVFGKEWFVQVDGITRDRPLTDFFADSRTV
jgi:LmbE family N-acetylglucosaminyl deacetylase